MFGSIADFLETWRRESARTARVFAALRDAALAQRVAEGYRSLGELAWHVVVSPRTILEKAGLGFDAPDKTHPAPSAAAAMHSYYVDMAQALGVAVAAQWTDDLLAAPVAFYGRRVPRGEALAVTLRHEIHHRGQMTVLMRQAGLRVPGVYGPSKDET